LNWLKNRRYGKGLSWYAFNDPYMNRLSIKKTLNLSQHKPMFALFTSSTDETAGDPELQGPYESQSSWVQDVVNWIGQKNDVELVIRVHPHLSGKTGLKMAVDEYNFYQDMKSTSPANVRIVMPDDPLNSYALMDEADIGLTYGSSVGIEMAMLGKRVVLASRAFYENGRHTLTIQNKQNFFEIMEKSRQPYPIREIRREAFRLAYYYVFEFELPFPLVSKLGVMDVKLNYTGVEALAAGQDTTIDHACGFLIEGYRLFDPPNDADLTRTTADEDAFFAELEQLKEPMRNFDYEKWLQRAEQSNRVGRSIQHVLQSLPLGAGYVLSKIGKALYLPFLRWIGRKT
jgi:hypothetical protein